MSRVKTLIRRAAPVENTTFLGRLKNNAKAAITSFFHPKGRQKLGFDPVDVIDKSTLLGKVQSALLPHIGYIDKTVLMTYLQRLKLPLVAIVGVAAVAGLAYLAYRLWNARRNHQGAAEEHKAASMITKDFEDSVPDLIAAGWGDTIKQGVADIVHSAPESEFVDRLARFKAELMEKQAKIAEVPHGGSLLNLISRRAGGGIAVPLY